MSTEPGQWGLKIFPRSVNGRGNFCGRCSGELGEDDEDHIVVGSLGLVSSGAPILYGKVVTCAKCADEFRDFWNAACPDKLPPEPEDSLSGIMKSVKENAERLGVSDHIAQVTGDAGKRAMIDCSAGVPWGSVVAGYFVAGVCGGTIAAVLFFMG